MTQRLNAPEQSPELFKKYVEFGMAVKKGAIEEKIADDRIGRRNPVPVRFA